MSVVDLVDKIDELSTIAYIIDKGSAKNREEHLLYCERFYHLITDILGDAWYNENEHPCTYVIERLVNQLKDEVE